MYVMTCINYDRRTQRQLLLHHRALLQVPYKQASGRAAYRLRPQVGGSDLSDRRCVSYHGTPLGKWMCCAFFPFPTRANNGCTTCPNAVGQPTTSFLVPQERHPRPKKRKKRKPVRTQLLRLAAGTRAAHRWKKKEGQHAMCLHIGPSILPASNGQVAAQNKPLSSIASLQDMACFTSAICPLLHMIAFFLHAASHRSLLY